MVTVSTTQIYAFNGSLLDLLGLQVAPSFTRLNGEIVDSNGVLNESDDTTISINGGPTQSLNFDSAGTVTGLVGLTGTRPIAVFTVPSNPGVTYLYAPDGLPNLLGLPVLYSYDLDQTSFALPTTTPGIVDGTDGDDIMPVGYTDADGDRITNNVFLGGNGNDVIDGKGGNDSITAGSGCDSVLGGEGNDTLDGQAGNDTLRGGNGDDLIRGGASADSLVGAERCARAVRQLQHGDVVFARPVGWRVTARDHAEGVGLACGDEFRGGDGLFRREIVDGAEPVIRAIF